MDTRIARINEAYVFADMHAHPSRFHRANVETISAEEIERYRSRHMDLVVANMNGDANGLLAQGASGFAPSVAEPSIRDAGVRFWPPSSTARSTRFASSRTLPGQA